MAKTGDAFSFITSEDEEMVRSIERVLRTKIRRCTLSGFDYRETAPSHDTEFTRPPRKPRRRRLEHKKPNPFKEHGEGIHFFGHR